ncbi:MAG TPA: FAD-dependent oxidoreductase [Galbitalea sp.]|jgi:2-polyprenyl-6-methoxyphenol hydroxylase-like FAD-dependent oxidoreductase
MTDDTGISDAGRAGAGRTTSVRTTTVCIVGGGPAGIMLGLLLARAGIEVTVLEKHADFFRDFRGDTIHPSTIDLIDQLGLRDEFEAVEQTRVSKLDAVVKGQRITPIDFSLLRGGARHLSLMPQWDFLAVLAAAGKRLPTFTLLMDTEATGLLREAGDGATITGVVATGSTGTPVEIRASLTIAADGRSSVVRAASGLTVTEYGVPVDVLWFRIPRPALNPPDTLAYITDAAMMITIPRHDAANGDYYQTAMLIPKGAFDAVRARGLAQFRSQIVDVVPFLEPVVSSLDDWADVKLLSVQVNRLEKWHLPGFLAIGDAAHAMSPAFGVGINYAIQDAVAAANILVPALRRGPVTDEQLESLQRRRARPTRRMQSLQLRAHAFVGHPGGGANLPSAGRLRVVLKVVIPPLRFVIARVIGRGFRPERIEY